MAHTPGPWTYEGPDEFCDYNIIGPNERLAIAAVANGLVREPEEMRDNARLIAAAPELLRGVKAAIPFLYKMAADGANTVASPARLAEKLRALLCTVGEL